MDSSIHVLLNNSVQLCLDYFVSDQNLNQLEVQEVSEIDISQ